MAVCWLAVAAVVLIVAPTIPRGGGVYPLALGCILAFLVALTIVRETVGTRRPRPRSVMLEYSTSDEAPLAASLLFMLIASVTGLATGGFGFSSTLPVGAVLILRFVYGQSWRRAMLLGMSAALGTLLLFNALGVEVFGPFWE